MTNVRGEGKNVLNLPSKKGNKYRVDLTYGAFDPIAKKLLKMKVGEVKKIRKFTFTKERPGWNIHEYLKWLAGRTFRCTTVTEGFYFVKRMENFVDSHWVPVRLGDIWYWTAPHYINRFEIIHINYQTGWVTLRNTMAKYDKKFRCEYKEVVDGQDVFIWDQLQAVNSKKGWWQMANNELDKRYAKVKTEANCRHFYADFFKVAKRIKELYDDEKTNPELLLYLSKVLEKIQEPLEFFCRKNSNVAKRRKAYDKIKGGLDALGGLDLPKGEAPDGQVGDAAGEVV